MLELGQEVEHVAWVDHIRGCLHLRNVSLGRALDVADGDAGEQLGRRLILKWVHGGQAR